jgi:hypothetical protein
MSVILYTLLLKVVCAFVFNYVGLREVASGACGYEGVLQVKSSVAKGTAFEIAEGIGFDKWRGAEHKGCTAYHRIRFVQLFFPILIDIPEHKLDKQAKNEAFGLCTSGYSEMVRCFFMGAASLRINKRMVMERDEWFHLEVGDNPFGSTAFGENLSVWRLLEAENPAPFADEILKLNHSPTDKWYYLAELWNEPGCLPYFTYPQLARHFSQQANCIANGGAHFYPIDRPQGNSLVGCVDDAIVELAPRVLEMLPKLMAQMGVQ